MHLFLFRVKDGNSLVVYANDQASAEEILSRMAVQGTAASVRPITAFVANFALTDTGDLETTLLDGGTLNQFAPDYPLLHAARAHSYADFGGSNTQPLSEPVLMGDAIRQKTGNWDRRDKDMIGYAVQQERERLSN